MSARESILARIRARRPEGEYDLPSLPDFTKPPPAGLVATFAANLTKMGGAMLAEGETLEARLAGKQVCSAAPEIEGTIALASIALPRDLAGVEIAVVRAAFTVAETGSVLLTEAELGVNALAYLAEHLIVLLDPADIVDSVQHAYLRPEFHRARYAAFHTGPSATADIEGVLIRGAQGVRSLTVALVPRQQASAAKEAA